MSNTEILPLYARLSNKEQNRIFRPHIGRRIVLSTNVAETSITVPGITSVIDPGMARLSRYSVRNKIQRLPIEAISQASAPTKELAAVVVLHQAYVFVFIVKKTFRQGLNLQILK